MRDGDHGDTVRHRLVAEEEAHGSRRALARALAGEGAEHKTIEKWRRALYRYIDDGVLPDDENAVAMANALGRDVHYFKSNPTRHRRDEMEELGRKLDELLELVRGVRSDQGLPIRLESSLREEVTEANRKLDLLFTHLGVSPDVSQDDEPSQPLEESDLRALLAAVRVMLARLEGSAGPDGQVAPEPAQLQER